MWYVQINLYEKMMLHIDTPDRMLEWVLRKVGGAPDKVHVNI